MHKLKKAVGELRTYLGKDTQGCDLLSAVESVADEVRKEASAARERAAEAMQLKEELVTSLRTAESEVRQLREGLQQAQTLIEQRARDAAAAGQRADELQQQLNVALGPEEEPAPASADLLDLPSLRSAAHALRRWRRTAPRPTNIVDPGEVGSHHGYMVYELSDLAPQMTNTHFLALGRFVAVCAVMCLPCLIQSRQTVATLQPYTKGMEHHVMQAFVRWYGKHAARAEGVEFVNVATGKGERGSVVDEARHMSRKSAQHRR